MGWSDRFSNIKVLVLAGLILATAAIIVAVLVAQPHSDRIVDCIPGYHNVSGPASDCVQNTQDPAPSP